MEQSTPASPREDPALLPITHPTRETSHRSTSSRPHQSPSSRARRARPGRRSAPAAPPSHDSLVVAFVLSSAFFALAAFGPFLLGNAPLLDGRDAVGGSTVEWFHRYGDGKGGAYEGMATNKTLLALHWLGLKKRRDDGEKESSRNAVEGDALGEARRNSLARGFSGLPMSKTPALVGAAHGTIQCRNEDGTVEHMDELAYWNDPQGDLDNSFVSPFASHDLPGAGHKKYVTFEPDRGGWNNIRMSMEIVVVFAAVTGRTLVLPPDTPFYLLNKMKGSRHRGFADFLNLEHDELRKHVQIITMTEFLQIEGGDGGLFTVPSGDEGKLITNSAEYCFYIAKSDRPCDGVYSFLRSVGYVPEIQAGRNCLIFDEESMKQTDHRSSEEMIRQLPNESRKRAMELCEKRDPIFFRDELVSEPLVHFHAGEKHHRLLNHFYTFIHFTNPKIDHYYKRFVRDFLHYVEPIYCAAGRVIRSIEDEASSQHVSNENANHGNGKAIEPRYSALHVRRGDFQYKKVKISAEEWYENTKELFYPNEIIYIATDEKNRTFFEPLARRYNLRFLDDYSTVAGMNDLDPNYAGMIDTIVASRARIFVGTWFSTFTGYINRMRGYHGMSGTTSYYSTPDRKFNTHKWHNPQKVMTAREWPTCWVGIDGDEIVSEESSLS